MASNPISNHNPLTSERDRSKRKKKKRQQQLHHYSSDSEKQNHAKWQTEAQQQIYSSKLIKALSQVRLSPPSSSAPRPGRAVREAADRALAFSAKGKTRWSRAILTSRIKIKFRKHNKRQKISALSSSSSSALITGNNRSSKKHRVTVLRLKKKSLPSVQRKVRVLGRLVPGCRKQPLPVILEEATDYIAALEMQVRAMSALADLLSGPSSSSGSGSISGPPRS